MKEKIIYRQFDDVAHHGRERIITWINPKLVDRKLEIFFYDTLGGEPELVHPDDLEHWEKYKEKLLEEFYDEHFDF